MAQWKEHGSRLHLNTHPHTGSEFSLGQDLYKVHDSKPVFALILMWGININQPIKIEIMCCQVAINGRSQTE